VKSPIAITLIAGALLLGRLSTAAAQDTTGAPAQATQDSTPQGYAPAEPAPVPPPRTVPRC